MNACIPASCADLPTRSSSRFLQRCDKTDQSAVITVQRGATHTQLARNAYPLKVIEAAKFHVADQNYSRSERFSQKGHTKSPAPSRGRISAPRVRSADGSRTNHRTRQPSRAQPGPHRNAMGELQGASRKNFIRCRGAIGISFVDRMFLL